MFYSHILNKISLFFTHIQAVVLGKYFTMTNSKSDRGHLFLCQCRRNGAKVALWHCYPNDWVAKGVACASCLNNMHAYNEEYSRCLKLMSAPFLICTSEFSESSWLELVCSKHVVYLALAVTLSAIFQTAPAVPNFFPSVHFCIRYMYVRAHFISQIFKAISFPGKCKTRSCNNGCWCLKHKRQRE